MSLPATFIDQLRQRTALSALVGRTVKLKRAGGEMAGCCPFHEEKTPSFYVNDDKGFAHCFGCGRHVDAIDWLIETRGLTFLDAVRELADAAGIAMPKPAPRAAAAEAHAATLHDVVARAARWFEERLAAPEGASARAYLGRRGVTPALARAFGLGFAPESRRALRDALAAAGEDRLVQAGLLIRPDDGREPYDRFRNRLVIPIRDPRGRPIAFGGRALGDAEPKYLNSPETPLFDKGATLFNLDRAAAAARRARRLVVVEGYFDVIALAGAGIDEVVAPLGTALTDRQLARAWRLDPSPTILFDGDAAGRKAAFRAAETALPALAPDRTLRFARLAAGQDPDDAVRSGGVAPIETTLAAADPLVELLWRHEVAAGALETPESRAGLKRRLEAHAARIEDRELSWQYLADLRGRANALFRAPRSVRAAASRVDPGALHRLLLDAILHGLGRYPELARRHVDRIARLYGGDAAQDAVIGRFLEAALRGGDIAIDWAPLPDLATGFRFPFNREERTDAAGEQLVAMIEALGDEIDRARAA